MRLVVNGRFLTQPVTGVQRYARELVATLDDALPDLPGLPGLDVEVVAPDLDGVPDVPSYRHVRLRTAGRLTGHAWEQLELPRLARGADVLFCPGNTAPLATLARGRTPVVATVHDLAFRDQPDTVSRSFRAAYNVVVPAVLRRAARVITVSDAERTRILRSFPAAGPRLVAVANGGLPRTPAVPADDDVAPPSGPFLLYVGAFNARKNVAGAVAAARRAMASHPGLRTVLIGGGADIYRDLDLGDLTGFVLPGKVSDASLAAHYEAATALVFPSFAEASGLPPVEAMAHGCPVVVSDIPALRERCGDAAVYCDPHDVDSIAAAVMRVLDDAVLAERLAADGRERAARFTWESCLEETLAVIAAATQVAGTPQREVGLS